MKLQCTIDFKIDFRDPNFPKVDLDIFKNKRRKFLNLRAILIIIFVH